MHTSSSYRTHTHTYTHTHTHTHILIPFEDCKLTGLKVDIALFFFFFFLGGKIAVLKQKNVCWCWWFIHKGKSQIQNGLWITVCHYLESRCPILSLLLIQTFCKPSFLYCSLKFRIGWMERYGHCGFVCCWLFFCFWGLCVCVCGGGGGGYMFLSFCLNNEWNNFNFFSKTNTWFGPSTLWLSSNTDVSFQLLQEILPSPPPPPPIPANPFPVGGPSEFIPLHNERQQGFGVFVVVGLCVCVWLLFWFFCFVLFGGRGVQIFVCVLFLLFFSDSSLTAWRSFRLLLLCVWGCFCWGV